MIIRSSKGINPIIIDRNIRVNSIFITIIQSLLSINPYKSDIQSVINKLFDLNEKYFYKFLSTTDITKKYEQSILKISEKEKEITELNNKIKILEEKLKNAVPEENQCIICFGYTHKTKVLIPCCHTKYCDDCIMKLDTCSLCRTKVTMIKKIYN